MRLFIYLVFMGATFYTAGIYRSFPLLLFFASECFLLPVLLVLTCYFRRKTSMEFSLHSDAAEKGMDYWCVGVIKNKGRLPVSKLQVRIRFGYAGKSKADKEKLFGGGTVGESELRFRLCARYCGMIQVKAEKLKVYDYLSLFSFSKALNQEFWLAVFPKEQALCLRILSAQETNQDMVPEIWTEMSGEASGEFRQTREYRDGDKLRHIHWSQSARTDRLWIREYDKETDSRAEVILETEPLSGDFLFRMDAFYELLSALVLGLLTQVKHVGVCWYGKSENGPVEAEISDAQDCRNLLFRLYQEDFGRNGAGRTGSFQNEVMMEGQNLFRLTTNLAWYGDETLIHRFSPETLETEIKEKVFDL